MQKFSGMHLSVDVLGILAVPGPCHSLLRYFPNQQRANQIISRLLKKTHMLRCAQSPCLNVLPKYASARRFFARRSAELGRSLASEIFLTSLQADFFNNLLVAGEGRFG